MQLKIAPVLVAALATEEPLLLIGPHGTAKSLLLTRIATALGLEFRHYNASLLNFDDLVGFPLPGKDGRLEYIRTPAAIWGAGAVIFDEVSRCRPEIQESVSALQVARCVDLTLARSGEQFLVEDLVEVARWGHFEKADRPWERMGRV